MYKDKFQKFIEEANKLGLTKEEHSAIKQSVLNFMASNPARTPLGSVKLGLQPRLLNQSRFFSRDWSKVFITNLNFSNAMAIFLILAVLVTGGVAVGAEKSLPGDILYPVKIGVNEEVQGWLAISEEAKTNMEIKRAEKRLEEAEELAADGSLDADVTAKIEANFEANAQRVRERIAKFNDKENFKAAASVSMNFETALKAHEKILAKLAARKGQFETQVKPIRARVNAEVANRAKSRQEINVRIQAQESSSGGESEVKGETDEDVDLDSEGGSVDSNTRLKVNLGL